MSKTFGVKTDNDLTTTDNATTNSNSISVSLIQENTFSITQHSLASMLYGTTEIANKNHQKQRIHLLF